MVLAHTSNRASKIGLREVSYREVSYRNVWARILVLGGLFLWGTLQYSELQSATLFQNWEQNSWGSFSQGFFFDFHSVNKSRFYQYGDLLYEYEANEDRNGEEIVGQDYVFESRTAYYYQYVTLMFIYTYQERMLKYFNRLGIENINSRQRRIVHSIMPHVYFTYEPLRLGISYYREFSNTPQKFIDEQPWSLRGTNAFSTHIQLYFAKIPKTPLGIALQYEFSFDPTIPQQQIRTDHFHRGGIHVDLYFTYYSQFKLAMTYENSTRDGVLFKATQTPGSTQTQNPDQYQLVRRGFKRYYIDYIFIYRFTNTVSINVLMGQMLYSDFESPAYRFKIGATYHLGS
ncbi:hypothetical protein COTS27_01271 [Spirochaetota bacterium]|nr:hypothetical protein COTS27_01271 [Spirochaetota bacterium]